MSKGKKILISILSVLIICCSLMFVSSMFRASASSSEWGKDNFSPDIWGANAYVIDGASLRITETSQDVYDYSTSGLRFSTLFKKSIIQDSDTVGMFIMRNSDYKELDNPTVESLKTLVGTSAINCEILGSTLKEGGYVEKYQDYYMLSFSVTNIKEHNKKTDFIAIGYINDEFAITGSSNGVVRNIYNVSVATVNELEKYGEKYRSLIDFIKDSYIYGVFNITYELNGGSATNPTTYKKETETFTLNNPTKTGYTFVGWTGSNGNIPQTTVTIEKGSTGDRYYTANWSANTYKITFDSNGGSSCESQNAIYNQNVTLPTPTKDTYTFDGWYYNTTKIESGIWTIAQDVTLTAKWTEKSILTVKYYDADGTLLSTSNNVKKGQADVNAPQLSVGDICSAGEDANCSYIAKNISYVWVNDNGQVIDVTSSVTSEKLTAKYTYVLASTVSAQAMYTYIPITNGTANTFLNLTKGSHDSFSFYVKANGLQSDRNIDIRPNTTWVSGQSMVTVAPAGYSGWVKVAFTWNGTQWVVNSYLENGTQYAVDSLLMYDAGKVYDFDITKISIVDSFTLDSSKTPKQRAESYYVGVEANLHKVNIFNTNGAKVNTSFVANGCALDYAGENCGSYSLIPKGYTDKTTGLQVDVSNITSDMNIVVTYAKYAQVALNLSITDTSISHTFTEISTDLPTISTTGMKITTSNSVSYNVYVNSISNLANYSHIFFYAKAGYNDQIKVGYGASMTITNTAFKWHRIDLIKQSNGTYTSYCDGVENKTNLTLSGKLIYGNYWASYQSPISTYTSYISNIFVYESESSAVVIDNKDKIVINNATTSIDLSCMSQYLGNIATVYVGSVQVALDATVTNNCVAVDTKSIIGAEVENITITVVTNGKNYVIKNVYHDTNVLLNEQIIDLNITNGSINTTDTTTLVIDNITSYGQVESMTLENGTILGTNLTFNVSKFGKIYGEETITIVIKHKNYSSITYTLKMPVLLATKVIKTASDIDNFGTWADLYSGTSGDGKADGYFILNNDITYNKVYTSTFLVDYNVSTPVGTARLNEIEGFNGVFDGNGKTIDGLRLVISNDDLSYNGRYAFIPKLTSNGVIKDTLFTNACVNSCAFLTAAVNEGTIENIYIGYKYFGSNADGTAYSSGRTQYTTTFCNNGGNEECNIKNCILDFTNDLGLTKASKNTNCWVLGNWVYQSFDNSLQGVYLVGVSDNTKYIRLTWYVEGRENYKELTKPTLYGNWAYTKTTDEFVTIYGDGLNSWDNWSCENGVVKFYGKTLFTGTKASTSTSAKLIYNDRKTTDYTIIYDNDIETTGEAAGLIAKEFNKASATVTLQKYTNPTTTKNINDNIYYKDIIDGGIDMNKATGGAWSDTACYIVVGNRELANKVGLKAPDGGVLIKKFGNSYFILCDNEEFYRSAAIVFLKEIIGYDVLSSVLVNFDIGSAIDNAPDINIEFEEGATSHYPTNKIDYGKYYQLDTDSTHYVGPSGTVADVWHNTFTWLPKSTYQTAHPNWYSDDGKQLCYTAHGSGTEYNEMVKTIAEKLYNAITEDDIHLTFTQEDTTTWCTCSTCAKNTTSFTAFKLVNDVCNYVDSNYNVKYNYTVSFFAYHKTFNAPTTAEFNSVGEINPHVGIVLAPIENAFAKSIYASENATCKAVMDTWNKYIKNIGCWFYDSNYGDYFEPYNTFASMLTWHEYACRVLHTEWLFTQGVSSSWVSSGFNAFKEFITQYSSIEILRKVNAYSSYGSDALYMADINKYLEELEEKFFGINIEGSTVTLVNSKGYYGPAGVEMYNLYKAEKDWYDSALKLLKSDITNNYNRYNNSTQGWKDKVDPAQNNYTGTGTVRDQLMVMAFCYKPKYTKYIIFHTSNTWCNIASTYYQDCFYPYINNTDVTNMFTILASATKKLSDAYANNYDDTMYQLYYNNIIAESLFSRYVACTARVTYTGTVNGFKLSNYDLRNVFYTYTYKGTTTTENWNTKWRHFKSDADSLYIDRIGEDYGNTSTYRASNGSTAGLYWCWANPIQTITLGYIDAYDVPVWA